MKRILLKEGWTLQGFQDRELEIAEMPSQVHDVLLDYNLITNPNITGINHDTWISEKEWCYRKNFELDNPQGMWNLRLEGLDTFIDVWLNGVPIGQNQSAYMPLILENVQGLREKNLLELKVKPPREELDKIELPEKYQDRITEFSKARVFRSGYHEFSGPKPELIRMGVYGNIYLEQVEEDGFSETVLDVSLSENLKEGRIKFNFSYYHPETEKALAYKVTDQNGNLICQGEKKENIRELEILVNEPKLWWPRSLGEPFMYEAEVCLMAGDKAVDCTRKQFGFRRLTLQGDMDYTVNGRPLKIWGGNLAHADTLTGCYNRVKEKLYGLLDLAEMGHFNCLRVWGESEILDDDFYYECDRRGILLWQDFYLGFNMYSEEEDMVELCRQEAVCLVKRLKHHPSILLWCGGNEMYWSRDMQYPGEYCFGENIFCEVYPKVCRELDAERYYHVSSPSGGNFSNDPLGGDTHGYTHVWFVPGREYPVFLSENCRVSAPELKTMKRMMTPEELWPKDYINVTTKRNSLSWPKSWGDHNTNEGAGKLGPVERFLDAENAEELIYRIGMAHSEYIRRDVERFRRGRRDSEQENVRHTKGHLLWKFNNNSNIISYGVVDYFNEPMRAYYALKRAYEPFLLSFSIEDHITLWGTNDTAEKVEGCVKAGLFSMPDNKVVEEIEFPLTCQPDESVNLGSLDAFGQFRKSCILFAYAVDKDGNLLGESIDYTEMERRLEFPGQGHITCSLEDGMLVLETDTFARCVELGGGEDGEEFGWIFEDNYFDLMPGQKKKIAVYGRHESGKIHVKPYYWENEITVDWER